jgi:hypothetical protein
MDYQERRLSSLLRAGHVALCLLTRKVRIYYSNLPSTVDLDEIRMDAVWRPWRMVLSKVSGGWQLLILLLRPLNSPNGSVRGSRTEDVFITLIDPRVGRSAWGPGGACTLLCEPFTVRRMDSTASKAPETEYRRAVKKELCDTNAGQRPTLERRE